MSENDWRSAYSQFNAWQPQMAQQAMAQALGVGDFAPGILYPVEQTPESNKLLLLLDEEV